MQQDLTNRTEPTNPLTVSHRSLKLLAAGTWYIGSLALLLKGGQLLVEAETLRPGSSWPWVAVATGLLLGSLKARFLFARSCRKNLNRIEELAHPRAWQFFRPGFFVALAAMITLGAVLSRLAHGNYPFLISVAVLDLSIGFALLTSSIIFWK